MRKLFSLFLLCLLISLTCLALGCGRKPIQNQNTDILIQGRFPDAEMQRVIIFAGKELGWSIVPVAPRQLVATKVLDDMKAVATINITDKSYQINYRNSENMDYRSGEIKADYNEWVSALNHRILREFANLQ